eukprot:scaffold9306_cov77-Skeletonema_dohrnii-CCMP3373.AAC.3
MTNKGRLRRHHRTNLADTVLLNHDVGIGVVTTVASAALPQRQSFRLETFWLNNSLLRPPHSGRRRRCCLLHRWTWLSRCKM